MYTISQNNAVAERLKLVRVIIISVLLIVLASIVKDINIFDGLFGPSKAQLQVTVEQLKADKRTLLVQNDLLTEQNGMLKQINKLNEIELGKLEAVNFTISSSLKESIEKLANHQIELAKLRQQYRNKAATIENSKDLSEEQKTNQTINESTRHILSIFRQKDKP